VLWMAKRNSATKSSVGPSKWRPWGDHLVMNPVSIPRLNDLLASPEAIACLAPDQIPAVLAELSAVQSALAARLLVAAAGGNGAGTSPEPDRMLSLDEASSILHQPINWIKRRKSLPFT
jgi:hypothetical protein